MTEIPEDILAVVADIIERVEDACIDRYEGAVSKDDPAEVIARAILAERERCAKIAEHLNGWGSDRGAGGHAEHIAAAIRNP